MKRRVALALKSAAKSGSNPREVVPTVPQGVILDDELSSYRCAKAQRKWRGAIQFIVSKGTYRGGCLTAVSAQQFESGGLGHFRMFAGVVCIELGDRLPGNIHDRLTGSDGSRYIDLDGIHAGDVVHNHSGRTTVVSGIGAWRAPFRFREPFCEGS